MEKLTITIARSYGSGGRTLGKKLSDVLGVRYYDREILRIASDESGISEALFGQADEYVRSLPLSKIAKITKGFKDDEDVLPPTSPDFTSRDNLFRYQAKTIRRLSDEESCIIIGRAADYVLRGRENVIRLFFYASRENCITRVVNQEGVSEKEAIARIERIDKARANYYKYFTGHDWNDARNFDLCLDTAAMSYEKLIEIVRTYVAARGLI